MSSNVVKCSTCNIVINELLAFVNNRIDVMDEVSISRICISAFSECEITNAKDLLFESVPTTLIRKVRKRNGKSLRNLDDIICVFKEADPNEIPIFVARELHKLPPVLFDHVDVTRLLKDIVKLQRDVKDIKEQYAPKEHLDQLKSEVVEIKRLSSLNEAQNNVNIRRGPFRGCYDDYQSGPMGLSPLCNNDLNARENDSLVTNNQEMEGSINLNTTECLEYDSLVTTCNQGKNEYRDIIQLQLEKDLSTMESTILINKSVESNQKINDERVCDKSSHYVVAMTHSTETAERVTVIPSIPIAAPGTLQSATKIKTPKQKSKSLAEIARGEWKPPKQDDEWTLVQRKRYRNRFVGERGNAVLDSEEKFKAADIKTPIYIYNVSKEVTTSDILNYIKNKSSLSVCVDQMNMKIDKNYNAFKIYVPKQKLDVFMKSDFWPEGIAYRRFINFFDLKQKQTGNGKDTIRD